MILYKVIDRSSLLKAEEVFKMLKDNPDINKDIVILLVGTFCD